MGWLQVQSTSAKRTLAQTHCSLRDRWVRIQAMRDQACGDDFRLLLIVVGARVGDSDIPDCISLLFLTVAVRARRNLLHTFGILLFCAI